MIVEDILGVAISAMGYEWRVVIRRRCASF
jgi:hypothetical protein